MEQEMQEPQEAQVQQVPESEEEQFETMVAGLVEYIHGQGKENIIGQLSEAQDVPRKVGELTFILVSEGSRQAQEAGLDLDTDMLFGVGTEVIDALLRVCEASGIDFGEPEAAQKDALATAMQSYMMTMKDDPDQQEIAKQSLADMERSGLVKEAAQYLQQEGASMGVDPFADAAPAKPQGGLMAQGG